jgi:hypothetical protein
MMACLLSFSQSRQCGGKRRPGLAKPRGAQAPLFFNFMDPFGLSALQRGRALRTGAC